MFIGEYEHSLDGKNRLSIPRKFRDSIEAEEPRRSLVITRGLDNCLFLFTAAQWDIVVENLKSKSFTAQAARRFQRLFYANASQVDLDNQGRILIPDGLKAPAGLTRNVTVVGVYDRIEIWDRPRWKAVKETSGDEYESLAEQLF